MEKDLVFEKLSGGEPLSIDQLIEYLPALKEEKRPILENFLSGAAQLRRYKPGEIICEEGTFGSTAFYIVSGKVEVFISSPLAHINTRTQRTFIARMKSFLVPDTQDHRQQRQRRFIPIDASVDLPRERPIAQLGAGELFGEMTCRTFQPRSATVRALGDCVMVEMLAVVLDVLLGTRAVTEEIKATTKVKKATFAGTSFKKQMEQKYRERALGNHLRNVPIFESLDDAFIEHLKQNVELVAFSKGEIVCKQGEPADAFYLIRSGMIKVSQSAPGGELVRTYLGRGDFFGEIGLIMNVPRTATCSALNYTELVKIKAADFQLMLEKFPAVKTELMKIAEVRRQANLDHALPVGLNMDEYLNQGLFDAQNLLIIDLDRCTRCDACVIACAEAHDGVTRLLRDGLRYDKYLVATACRTCRDPLCITQCPVGSIRRKDSLEILIEDWCIGCGKCAELCPYDNINMHPVELAKPPAKEAPAAEKKKLTQLKATTCDLCTDMAVPSCVYACPHDAAMRVEPAVYFAGKLRELRGSQPLTVSLRPRVETRTTH
jgi:CRP-like cAMP-binding protein